MTGNQAPPSRRLSTFAFIRTRLQRFFSAPAFLTAAMIAVVAALFLWDPPPLEVIELNWLDLRFRARGPLTPGPAVVIAAIDEKSLEAEGRWPWPRSKMAALLDALSADGARVVAFDILFSESEQDTRLALIDEFAAAVQSLEPKNPKLEEFIRRSRAAADSDRRMVTALERSKVPVVLGYFFHMDESSVGYKVAAGDVERRLEAIGRSKYPVVYSDGDARSVPVSKAYVPQTNLSAFARAAASSGYFNVKVDRDGVVRWMPLALEAGDDVFPSLAVLCVWHYLGKPNLAVRSGRYGVDGIQIGERLARTDEIGQLLINYRGPPGTFPTYSISDIVGGKLPQGTFKNKIVIVGATAIGIGDIRNTPYGALYPGPEVQASVVDNILAGDFIDRPAWSRIFDLLAIIGLALLTALAMRRASALVALGITAALFALYVAVAHYLFVHARVWLNMVYPLLALAATYTLLTLHRYALEERERRRITATFQHYVAPDVIEVMLKDPGGVRLGGQERVLTGLISDMEGFTSFSERHTPAQVIEVIGEYYAYMTEQVFAYQGTLVEYVGDELFALFGAPVTYADHAKRACASALAMQAQRTVLGEAWEKIGRPRIKARTGIHSGAMLVGNIGSKYRFHYGAMGDAVNLTSRLEQLNKVYGTEILISEGTRELVENAFLLRELDTVQVKGREQVVRIYELLGRSDAELPPEQKKMLDVYALALRAYRAQRWAEALRLFAQCRVLYPPDGAAELMIRRCLHFRADPPAEDWDGAFRERRGQRVLS